MMRSLYSAISGLKNHQVKMDVVGDNIANVNTLGFKRSRASFSTMLSETMRGASAPSPTQGGTNAIQVGLGAMLGSVDKIMTQGSSQTTGKGTDLMIQGPGFFVMDNGGQTLYTRAGGFGFDRDGQLEDPASGARVQGYSWGADDSAPVSWMGPGYGAIKFSLGDSMPQDKDLPIKIDKVKLGSTVPGFDTTDPVSYTSTTLMGAGNVTVEGMTRVQNNPKLGQFTFDPVEGKIQFAAGYKLPSDELSTDSYINYVAAAKIVVEDENNPNKITAAYMPTEGAKIYTTVAGTTSTYTKAPSLAEVNDDPNYYWAENMNGKYSITFSNATGSPTPPSGDDTVGYDFLNKPRTLTNFSIDQSGIITGVYTDGVVTATRKIAQIAIAKFSNDAGLVTVGGNFYSTTNNSGDASIGAAAVDGRGLIVPSAVEMSNVDLSQEFTDMIVTQRGFQANSRVITVSDSLLQELIDLKR